MTHRRFVLKSGFCFAVGFLLAFAGPAFSQSSENFNGRPAVSEEILIRLRSNGPDALARVRGADPSAIVETLSPALGLHRVRARGNSVAALLQRYGRHADVLYAEPNYIVHSVDTVPNDVSYPLLWGMARISAPAAWDVTTGSTSAVVGVVDTGIDYNHPDLVANIWSAPSAFTVTVGGQFINCPAGSHGFNAITLTCSPLDDHGHGTHVSGTIGATGNNSTGVAGVNWRTRIMGLKFLNASGDGTISAAVNAIEFAIQVKARFAGTSTPVDVRVLSNSWGTNGYSQSLFDEISRANGNEMLFVAAAGNSSSNNDGAPFYPASFSPFAPNVVAVAATDSGDNLASFSNFGANSVHLAAPGVAIYSTVPGGYATLDGTSMATPHVSGAAMLTLASCPLLSTAALKSALIANVDVIPSLAGRTMTGGRLNVNRATRVCQVSSTLRATFRGVTGQDFVGINGSSSPNGVPDWHLQIEGLRGTPTKIRISTAPQGIWEVPFNGANWFIAAQYGANGTADFFFEPWNIPSGIHVKVWYADGSTDEIDAVDGVLTPPSTLQSTFVGVTGQDFVGTGGSSSPDGVPDWHLQVQGLRGTPTKIRISTAPGGIWEVPYNGWNWFIASQYGGNGTGDFFFEPWNSPTGIHLQVWYADGTTDEADAVQGVTVPPTFQAAFLGATGEDFVGVDGSSSPNGVADWHIQVSGLRGIPTKIRISTAPQGIWEVPFNGANWFIATQFGADGTADFFFEPWNVPIGIQVQVWYADGSSDQAATP